MFLRKWGFSMRQLFSGIVLMVIVTGSAKADTLFEQLGGMETISRISSRTFDLSLKDERTRESFRFVDLGRVKEKLALQICELAAGPCVYDGDPMKPLHKPMKITTVQFNAVVEALQQAMDEEKIAFRVQNKLIAILAPLHKEIVTIR